MSKNKWKFILIDSKFPNNFIEVHVYHHVTITLHRRFRISKHDSQNYRNTAVFAKCRRIRFWLGINVYFNLTVRSWEKSFLVERWKIKMHLILRTWYSVHECETLSETRWAFFFKKFPHQEISQNFSDT
jgi:hypothetical protein